MRIFVTGAASALGRRVCALLSSHEIVALRHRAPVPGRAVDGALERPASYADAANSADAVVHMAALTRARRREDYFRVNVEGTAALLSASRGHFVFVSTRAIGAGGGGYAASKLRAENLIKASGRPWTILRPSEIRESREGLSSLLTLARRFRVFPIPFWPTPTPMAPVDLESVAQAVARCVGEARCHGKTYVLAGPRVITFPQMRPPGVLGVPLPLFALHAAAVTGACPGVAPDQVSRLLLSKETDASAAARDLEFHP